MATSVPAWGSVMQMARMHSPVHTAGRIARLIASGRIGRDDAGLHADLAQHRHGGDVADLGDFLEHQRGVEHRKSGAAIFLRHRHAEDAELRRGCGCSPRGTCRSCIAGRAA